MTVSWWLAGALAVINLAAAQDTLGLSHGYVSLKTKNFDFQIVKDAQVLASLKPAGSSFDFLPFDYLSRRARNGQYHWGDVTIRYRQTSASSWTDVSSAAARKPVTSLQTDSLAASSLAPTLPSGPLNITREWLDVNGDVGLRFTITNIGNSALEIGSLGYPAEFNSIFTGRTAEQIQQKCSLSDPYIGMHGGYIRTAPVRGNDSALIVTPLGDTPFEAYRNLNEASYQDTGYGSQTFEGFYEWQVLTKAWAEKEWASKQPWNPPSSRVLQPQESVTYGLKFSVAKEGVRGIDNAVANTGTPVVTSVPGYILPRDLPAQLFVRPATGTTLESVTVEPSGALQATKLTAESYQLVPSDTAWGRVRVTLKYSDQRVQTVHYYITKPATDAIANLGRFSTTAQWFTDKSDPFGRAPSPMTYDYEAKAIVTQDYRVWIAGLSDEGGAGSFLAATMKQALQPNADEVTKLEQFVSEVMWGTIQTKDFGVRKSIFFYEPSAVPGYKYNSSFSWTGWQSWNKAAAYAADRAYDYVHVAAAYWALYRVGRGYPDLLKTQKWDWYLNQSYSTVMKCVSGNAQPGYSRDGLMGETIFGEILTDLRREGQSSKADSLEASMLSRSRGWDSQAVPYGSEMAWDSTGQEGIYYWSKYFGSTATATKTLNTVLGFQPTVPHWGWNGNARRYWDNIYGGKLQRIERQIHHYGSGLNALVLLSAFRSNPTDAYLLRAGYGGMNGPLSNINQDGFAAASFHSWPDTLKWDGISGDYGPGFVGLALGAATYLVEDPSLGLVAYGGIATTSGTTTSVQTRDAARRKFFVGPLGLLVSVDAGIIQDFSYDSKEKTVTVTLAQLSNAPKASAAVLWLEVTSGSTKYTVKTTGLQQARLGWQVPLTSSTRVVIGPA